MKTRFTTSKAPKAEKRMPDSDLVRIYIGSTLFGIKNFIKKLKVHLGWGCKEAFSDPRKRINSFRLIMVPLHSLFGRRRMG